MRSTQQNGDDPPPPLPGIRAGAGSSAVTPPVVGPSWNRNIAPNTAASRAAVLQPFPESPARLLPPAAPPALVGMRPPPGMTVQEIAAWREREQRQRTVRVLMMFLMMLLLMDDDAEYAHRSERENNNDTNARLRLGHKNGSAAHAQRRLDPAVFAARHQQEVLLNDISHSHARYEALLKLNGGVDVQRQIVEESWQQSEMVKDQFFETTSTSSSSSNRRSESIRNLVNSHNDDDNGDERSTNSVTGGDMNDNNNKKDATQKIFHYPWNSTGFYRGDWSRAVPAAFVVETEDVPSRLKSTTLKDNNNYYYYSENDNLQNVTTKIQRTAVQLESSMLHRLRQRRQAAAVLPLSYGYQLRIEPNHRNNDTFHNETAKETKTRSTLQLLALPPPAAEPNKDVTSPAAVVTLTRDDGRAAFQLFGTALPGAMELSLISGFVKLYDSTAAGYSTRKDVLLRVRGVLLHSTGKLSLVANVPLHEMALVLDPSTASSTTATAATTRVTTSRATTSRATTTAAKRQANGPTDKKMQKKIIRGRKKHRTNQKNVNHSPRRRLEPTVSVADIENDDADNNDVNVDSGDDNDDDDVNSNNQKEPVSDSGTASNEIRSDDDMNDLDYQEKVNSPRLAAVAAGGGNIKTRALVESPARQQQRRSLQKLDNGSTVVGASLPATVDGDDDHEETWSNIVIPYPFIRDDQDGTIRNARTPASRTMPQREQALEANSAGCIFEINMDVSAVEWTVGAWRKLIARRVEEVKKSDPALHPPAVDSTESTDGNTKVESSSKNRRDAAATRPYSVGRGRQRRARPIQDQALVMNMIGTIHSPNCNFTAFLNTTALRTDWDATTSKAINYSFYMMIVCLTQILILLRQLLHSQSQSTATRVSLLCIGWQTVIDALLCLAHIYLSLAVQPLFTAFASVAFFKLLIFCVIEMKYMAIIIQARNSSSGGQPTDVLRRQLAMLHLRFYGALLVAFLLMFYAPGRYRVYYMLVLYSFWLPQIVLNVITEAKTPLHKHYIYGMSLTRLVAPLYIFGLRNNFLKEVYPESETDRYMCQMVVLWVGVQTAILVAQGKYGARFMIPARFLPPKFDYSRPIPPSMLPPGALLDLTAPELMEDRDDVRVNGGGGTPKREGDCDNRSGTASSCEQQNRPVRHQTAETTRNRHKSSRQNQYHHHGSTTMTREDLRPPSVPASVPSCPVLECSICYDAIDIRDRLKYMLAPCNHLFHRDCLAQWMDVKMECPICRTELPAL